MQAMINRSVVPVLLLAGGVVSFVYGTWFHGVPVTQNVIKQVKEKVTYDREITLREELQKLANDPNVPWYMADDARQKLDTLPEELLSAVVDSEKDTRIDTKLRTDATTMRLMEPALTLEMTTGGRISLAGSGGLMRPVWDTTKGEEPDADAAGVCET